MQEGRDLDIAIAFAHLQILKMLFLYDGLRIGWIIMPMLLYVNKLLAVCNMLLVHII